MKKIVVNTLTNIPGLAQNKKEDEKGKEALLGHKQTKINRTRREKEIHLNYYCSPLTPEKNAKQIFLIFSK